MARRLAEEAAASRRPSCPTPSRRVLAARLDALDPFERRLVQQAAVVGRTFWESSLGARGGRDGRDLEQALISLQEKDILAPAPRAGSTASASWRSSTS